MKKKMTLFGGSLAVVALAVLGFQILFAGSTNSVSTEAERTSVASDRLWPGCSSDNSVDVRVVDGADADIASGDKSSCMSMMKRYDCSSKKAKSECSASDRAAKKEECRKKCDYGDKKTEAVDTDDPVVEFN